MWDLNDSPDPMRDADSRSDNDEEEEENSSPENAATDNKGKEPESASTADNDDSGSSVLVAEASDEVDGDRCRRIFGFSVGGDGRFPGESEPAIVTHQFFPVEEAGARGSGGAEGPLLRAHWVGVKFCQSSETAAAGKPMEASQPMKKSRRGPRSRSSQYRGVNPGARSTGEGPGPGVQQCRGTSALFLSFSLTRQSQNHSLRRLPAGRVRLHWLPRRRRLHREWWGGE